MEINRRDILKLMLAAGAATILPNYSLSAKSGKKLKILVLGGTSFLGPAIVEDAIARGHTVTLFNRGKTNPQLFPQLEKLRGNRFPELDQGLNPLKNRCWDVAIDVCGYFPRVVKASAELLKPAVSHYIYISSISVYTDYNKTGITEIYPVRTEWDSSDETERGETYGARKFLCEKAVMEIFPKAFTIPRSTVIAGLRNDTDGSRYWPVRMRRGGEVLAPGDGADPLQYMDVQDLGRWVIKAAEEKIYGTFNTVGPAGHITMQDYLLACKRATNSSANITWVSEDFIRANKLRSRSDFPLWSTRTRAAGFMQIDNSKAVANGLTFRPVEQTILTELKWFAANFPADYKFGLKDYSGITAEREQELLKLWHSKT